MIKSIFSRFLVCGILLAAPALSFGQTSAESQQPPAAEAHTDGALKAEQAPAHEEAAEAHEAVAHHAQGIPMSVTFQAINFLIFVGLLVYLLRNPIRGFFRSREEIYKQALVRAEHARLDAERKHAEVEERLRALESGSAESIEGARAEAAALMSQITREAKELAERLRQEAARSAQMEVERAKNHLREEMLNQSLALSKKMLADKMAEGDQKRLQTEFVDKIQEVR